MNITRFQTSTGPTVAINGENGEIIAFTRDRKAEAVTVSIPNGLDDEYAVAYLESDYFDSELLLDVMKQLGIS